MADVFGKGDLVEFQGSNWAERVSCAVPSGLRGRVVIQHRDKSVSVKLKLKNVTFKMDVPPDRLRVVRRKQRKKEDKDAGTEPG